MALNYPGPFELRLYYTTTVSSTPLTHVARYNIDIDGAAPGAAFSAMNVKSVNGSNPTLAAYLSDWVDLFRPVLSSGAGNSIDYAELWEVTPGTFDMSFVSAESIGLAGLSGSTTQPASQGILTFRTVQGGILKLSFMECVFVSGNKDTPPFSLSPVTAIADFVTGGDNAFLGRDTSRPFAVIAFFPGQNEALFKRRFRA